MSSKVRLVVEASGKTHTWELAPEHRLLPLTELLRRRGLPLNTRCGQRGLCDSCRVEVLTGELTQAGGQGAGSPTGVVGPGDVAKGCLLRVGAEAPEVHLRVPDRSLLSQKPQIVSQFRLNVTAGQDPIEPLEAGRLGIAIDIGTTTVAVMLIDRAEGTVLGSASDFNHQIHIADDVLTRINLCMTDPDMLHQMQRAIIRRTLKPLLRRLLESANVHGTDVGAVTIAANTTMLYLLTGEDPSSLGVAPFTAEFLEHRRIDAAALGLWPLEANRRNETDHDHDHDEHDDRDHAPSPTVTSGSAPGVDDGSPAGPHHAWPLHLLPGAAAYVGADITAGVLATGLLYDPGPSLLVDAGTNGEIVLHAGGRLVGCATAAGPAFEGAGLSHGARAAEGAISRIEIQPDAQPVMTVHTIGDARAVGVCGSAYLDLLAQGVASGLIKPSGRLDAARADELGLQVEATSNGYGLKLHLARGLGGMDVSVSEADLASLLQAKGAIAAGILTLLRQQGLTPADVKTLYLAGGFGMHLNVASAIGCGLLPGFRPEQIQVVGNTSLGGAFLSLLDASALDAMRELAADMTIIELNLDPEFESCYIDQLQLPGG